MTREEVIAAAQHAGYTVIQTAGGVIPLKDWWPYGMATRDPRMWRRVSGWDFLYDPPQRARIVDRVPAGGERPGVWLVGRRV